MTPIIDRMEGALRRYMSRRPGVPVAVLIHPLDDLRLDLEYRDLRPPYGVRRSIYDSYYGQARLVDKKFKGMPVLCDPRVPQGCVAMRFKPFPSLELCARG